MQLFDHISEKMDRLIELMDIWQTVSVTKNGVRDFSKVRIKFWSMKVLWHHEHHYVTILNMEVWLHLEHLAPDMPDGWSFPDKISYLNSVLKCTEGGS